MTQCTATSKRTGQRCGARAVTGKTVCYHHGGKSLVGPASGTFQSGRYSKYLPERMLARYHEAEADGEYLALKAEVALIDARLHDVLQRVDTGESSRIWIKVQDAIDELQTAQLIDDEMGQRHAIAGLIHLVKAGQADWAAWTDVRTLVQERKALVESERKRLVEAQQVIAIDQALAVMGLLVKSVQTHVRDPVALRAIVDDWTRLTAGSRPVPVLGNGGDDSSDDGPSAGNPA